jgi:hypothetical protein
VSGYQSGVTRTRSLSGRVLGRALSEISRASLYNYDADGGDLAFRVSGVAAVLHALAVVDFESVSEDPAAIFYTLGRLLMDDLASERARNFSDTVLKEGIVTISAVPTEQQTAVA